MSSLSDFYLIQDQNKWAIVSRKHPEFKPFFLDFTSGSYLNIFKKGISKKDPLAKAIGTKKPNPKVLDLTAGWLKDTWMMLRMGCEVTAVEKNNLVYELLDKTLQELAKVDSYKLFLEKLTLHHEDSKNFIAKSDLKNWDVVYIDPMFPQKTKTALAGKEMQILQSLISSQESGENLLMLTLQKGTKRVVVKRPKHSESLFKACSFSVESKASRFDVYINAD